MKISKIVASAAFLGSISLAQVVQAEPYFTQCSSLPGTKDTIGGGCNALIVATDLYGLTIHFDPEALGIGGVGLGYFSYGLGAFVGVLNNSSATLYSIHISSSEAIFGFNGNGTLSVAIGRPYSDYAPRYTKFTDISTDKTSGNVNFTKGVLPGQITAFELAQNWSSFSEFEQFPVVSYPAGGNVLVGSEPPSEESTVSEPATTALLGLGLLGFAVSRRNLANRKTHK